MSSLARIGYDIDSHPSGSLAQVKGQWGNIAYGPKHLESGRTFVEIYFYQETWDLIIHQIYAIVIWHR